MLVKRKFVVPIICFILLTVVSIASAVTPIIEVDNHTNFGKPIFELPVLSSFEIKEAIIDLKVTNNGTDGYGTVKIETNDTNE